MYKQQSPDNWDVCPGQHTWTLNGYKLKNKYKQQQLQQLQTPRKQTRNNTCLFTQQNYFSLPTTPVNKDS